MKDEKPIIIVICGPTSVGKTGTAISLAGTFGGEIIGADSMQIYRHMDIGTAKPSMTEQAAVQHHMIDIRDPDESYDAGTFADEAFQKTEALNHKGTLPFLVGGTGLYIKALIYGLSRTAPVDPAVLSRLKKEVEKYGSRALHKRLQEKDRDTARKIHPNDSFRIIRALEVFEKTGTPVSTYHGRHGFSDPRLKTLMIGLHMERHTLYERIDRRVDTMIKEGLLEEVKDLLQRGYKPELKSMQSIGYRHMTDYLNGDLSWEDAIATLKRDTRRYAKRQLTWFGADNTIKWFKPHALEEITKEIKAFLHRIRPNSRLI